MYRFRKISNSRYKTLSLTVLVETSGVGNRQKETIYPCIGSWQELGGGGGDPQVAAKRTMCVHIYIYIYRIKKNPHKTLRVHSARYTQCIHTSFRKLKLPKDTRTKKYKQLLPTHPFPKVELYIAVK